MRKTEESMTNLKWFRDDLLELLYKHNLKIEWLPYSGDAMIITENGDEISLQDLVEGDK